MPRLVIPVRFGSFWPKKAKKPETNWDDNLWKPKLVIPVRLGLFWPKRAKKTRNGLGQQPWEAQACHPNLFRGLLAEKSNPFRGFLAEKGQQTPKRTGLTTVGSPGLSSQSVSGFSGRKGTKKPEMDWDDNPEKPRLVIPIRFGVFLPKRANKNPKQTGMTTLGNPVLSSQSVSGCSGRKWPKTLETDWDGNPGKPKLVIPVRFGFFLAEKGQKNPKRTWIATLGSPGLSSQSVLGFSGQEGPNNPETDRDDNPGKPRLVIPIGFGVFWPKRAKKPQDGLG